MSEPLPSTVLAKVTAQSCLNLFSNTKNVIVHRVWKISAGECSNQSVQNNSLSQ